MTSYYTLVSLAALFHWLFINILSDYYLQWHLRKLSHTGRWVADWLELEYSFFSLLLEYSRFTMLYFRCTVKRYHLHMSNHLCVHLSLLISMKSNMYSILSYPQIRSGQIYENQTRFRFFFPYGSLQCIE